MHQIEYINKSANYITAWQHGNWEHTKRSNVWHIKTTSKAKQKVRRQI